MRQIILECDEDDYSAIQEAIAKRQTFRCMPDHDGNEAGGVIAEICRGWLELLQWNETGEVDDW